MFWPCETRTSTCRNFATISSGLYRFLVITVLLDVKDIPQVGPLQWGRINVTQLFGLCLSVHRSPRRSAAMARAGPLLPGLPHIKTVMCIANYLCPLSALAAVTAVTVILRIPHYFLDGRFTPGAGNALGAGCDWLWSCGGAGRPAGSAAR